MSATTPLSFFLGDPAQPVFGVFHPPAGTTERGLGVVLCQPFGHEYFRSHRAVRSLAARLSREGFPTLRFDYTGTGDSAGDDTNQSFDQWHADLALAIEEIRDMAAVRQVILIGLRLGGTVACTFPADSTVTQLIMWDPIVSGGRYASELEGLHSDFVRHHHPRLREYAVSNERERLGQRFSHRLTSDIEGTDLMMLERPPTSRIAIVVSESRAEYTDLHNRMNQLGSECRLDYIPDTPRWRSIERLGEAILAPGMVKHVISLVTSGL